MRLWERKPPGGKKAATRRSYETVGFVVSGRAELHLEGQMVLLEPGDSWVVPKGSSHAYKILEPFTAVEATCPPAEVHGRDEGRTGVHPGGAREALARGAAPPSGGRTLPRPPGRR